MLILRPFVMQSCKADRQLSIHVPHSQNGLTLIELLPCKLMRLGKKMLIVNHFFFVAWFISPRPSLERTTCSGYALSPPDRMLDARACAFVM